MWFGLDSSYQPTFSSIRFVPGFPIPTCLSFLHTTNLATHDQPTNRSCSTTISIPIFSIFATLLTLDWWDTILRNEPLNHFKPADISNDPPTTLLPAPEPWTTIPDFSPFHISPAPVFINGTSLFSVIRLGFFIPTYPTFSSIDDIRCVATKFVSCSPYRASPITSPSPATDSSS
jgi:hypothetical protein